MKFQGITGDFAQADADALAVPVFKGEKAGGSELRELDKITGGLITSVMTAEEFKGEAGETALLRFSPKGAVKASRMVLIGMGEKADYSVHSVAHLAGTAVRFLNKRNIKRMALLPRAEGETAEIAQFAVQGCITSQFELDKYKTKDKNDKALTS